VERPIRIGLAAALALGIVLIPQRAASEPNMQPHIELIVSLADIPPAVVNVTAPDQTPIINMPEIAPPVINVTIPDTFKEPTTVIVEPAPVLPAEIRYEEKIVEVEKLVEVPSCLDYTDLPYFDLANALTRAFPGALWSLNGSHYNGLTWHSDEPMPDMTAIIGGWLQDLSKNC
jgi:hypothetical protein